MPLLLLRAEGEGPPVLPHFSFKKREQNFGSTFGKGGFLKVIFILIYIRMTAWNDFVKKIYHEGKKNNAAYQFKNALKDASARKGEMGKMAAAPAATAPKKSKKRGKSKGKKSKGGTRRRKRGKR
jgi:hypothetical protein